MWANFHANKESGLSESVLCNNNTSIWGNSGGARLNGKYQNQSSWVPQMPAYKYYNQLQCKANNEMQC